MPHFQVSCVVTYRRTWSDIEADSAAEALELVQQDDPEADDFPGNCLNVDEWEAEETKEEVTRG